MAVDPTKNYDSLSSILLLTMENNALFNTILDQIVEIRTADDTPDRKKEIAFEVEKSLNGYRERATEFLIERTD